MSLMIRAGSFAVLLLFISAPAFAQSVPLALGEGSDAIGAGCRYINSLEGCQNDPNDPNQIVLPSNLPSGDPDIGAFQTFYLNSCRVIADSNLVRCTFNNAGYRRSDFDGSQVLTPIPIGASFDTTGFVLTKNGAVNPLSGARIVGTRTVEWWGTFDYANAIFAALNSGSGNRFEIDGNETAFFQPGVTFNVGPSGTPNEGTYTVQSVSYDSPSGRTRIVPSQSIPQSNTDTGEIGSSGDLDYFGNRSWNISGATCEVVYNGTTVRCALDQDVPYGLSMTDSTDFALTKNGQTNPILSTIVRDGTTVDFVTASNYAAGDTGAISYTRTDGLSGQLSDNAFIVWNQPFLTVQNFPVSVVAGSGALVASLAFNEGAGQTAADTSGYGNNGTFSTGVSWTTAGRYGSGLSFDGTGAVTIPYSASLDLSPVGMTLAAWVYPTELSGTFSAIAVKSTGFTGYWLYSSVDPYLCNNATAAGGFGTTVNVAACDTSVLPLNAWTHLAATFDGLNVRFYRNATLIRTTVANQTIAPGSAALMIGGSIYGEFFKGTIDEVKVYNYARTAGEIAADMGIPEGIVSLRFSPGTTLKLGAGTAVLKAGQ